MWRNINYRGKRGFSFTQHAFHTPGLESKTSLRLWEGRRFQSELFSEKLIFIFRILLLLLLLLASWQ